MVCIAAFIILCLISVVVAFLSIFKRDIGQKWWKVFKKAWHCVFKKVRLQKCDTNFKDDVKNTILKKVVLKRPKLVKPLSALIEVVSVLIVLVTVWSLVIAIKSLLALWVFGTCNVSQPSQCSLGAEACSIDAEEPTTFLGKLGQGIGEWGEIFGGVPDRLRSWDAQEYLTEPAIYLSAFSEDQPYALDIMDPGCSVCLQSYKNQLSSGFMSEYNVALLPYAIQLPDGSDKFNNSTLIVRYLFATTLYEAEHGTATPHLARDIINRIFTESGENHINYQSHLASLSEKEASALLNAWLREFGASASAVSAISESLDSPAVSDLISRARTLVEDSIHAKGIPTLLYNSRKHNGLYK